MKNKGKNGFSIIELTIFVAVVALIAIIMMPSYISGQEKNDASICEANREFIITTAKAYIQLNEIDENEIKNVTTMLLLQEGWLDTSHSYCPCDQDYNKNAINSFINSFTAKAYSYDDVSTKYIIFYTDGDVQVMCLGYGHEPWVKQALR